MAHVFWDTSGCPQLFKSGLNDAPCNLSGSALGGCLPTTKRLNRASTLSNFVEHAQLSDARLPASCQSQASAWDTALLVQDQFAEFARCAASPTSVVCGEH